MTEPTNKKRKIGFAIIGLLVTIALVLLALPANYFDTGQSMCVSVLLFDKECYGCGMTRGIQHLIHLEFKEAWNFNMLSFIVAPLIVIMTAIEIKKRYFSN